MIRTLALAAVLATAGVAAAQPPWPPPPAPVGLEGRWFMSGDPHQPCYIQVFPGPRGPQLVFTNEKGDRSRGRILLGGRRVIADDWGGLVGDIRDGEIVWRNGTDWVR